MSAKTAKMLLDELKQVISKTKTDSDVLEKKYGSLLGIVTPDLFSSYMRDIIVQPILSAMTEYESNMLKDVLVEAIPMGEINAHSYKAENDEYVVVINERFMSLIYTWNELQFIALHSIQNGSDLDYFAMNFAPIIDCYLNPCSDNTLPIFNYDELPIEFQELAATKTVLCEQFIIAHEFAHIYLRHCKDASDKLFNEDYITTYPANSEEQQKEFDADVLAVKWLIALSKLDSSTMSKEHVLLWLEVFAILNLIESNLGFPQATSTHPSSIARLINIKDNFGSEILRVGDYSIDKMIENLKDIDSFKIRRNPFE